MLLATPAIRNSIQIPKMNVQKNLVNLTSSTSTLLQVGFRGPNSSIVGHVIMRSKQLHFGLATVNDKNDIINGDRCLSNVGAQDDLSHAIRDVAKDKSLIFAWQLGVQRNNPVEDNERQTFNYFLENICFTLWYIWVFRFQREGCKIS